MREGSALSACPEGIQVTPTCAGVSYEPVDVAAMGEAAHVDDDAGVAAAVAEEGARAPVFAGAHAGAGAGAP